MTTGCQLPGIAAAGLSVLLAATAIAAEASPPSPELFHYQLFCQGCHSPGGDGYRGVPALRDFVGHYVHDDEGRAFLIRVPGVSNSPLADPELAALMNWIVERFAGSSLERPWQPFTAEEIARYRHQRIDNLPAYRARLLAELLADGAAS
jgi:hypothetical protein